MPFEILTVDPHSFVGDEQLGSKTKFWFQRNEDRWLFKEARPNTGEDWAEKIAGEIAHRLGIRAATVELADFEGHRGVACRSFVSTRNLSLVHGNEILAGQIVGYDRDKRLRQSDHTLKNIVTAVRDLTGSGELSTQILRLLAGYFVLDALICNTDRHHENWGFLTRLEGADNGDHKLFLEVAPSFDHASSLGRELTDEGRAAMLNDSKTGQYAKRGKGGIYLENTDHKGANPLALVQFGMQEYPDYFGPAVNSFRDSPLDGILAVVDEVPESRMSHTAKEFARQLLTFTQGFLLELQS
jgi:HipA-like C-terminal domain